ncbi:MAG: hypothetical protein ABJA98_27735 [Acidobacteriota bacterium]
MDELEERLRRYRPVGPPPGLRARVVGPARTPARRRLAWLPCAAAAAVAITFYSLAAGVRREVAAEISKEETRREAIVQTLTADLGGGVEAATVAARLVDLNEATASAGVDRQNTLDAEIDRHD